MVNISFLLLLWSILCQWKKTIFHYLFVLSFLKSIKQLILPKRHFRTYLFFVCFFQFLGGVDPPLEEPIGNFQMAHIKQNLFYGMQIIFIFLRYFKGVGGCGLYRNEKFYYFVKTVKPYVNNSRVLWAVLYTIFIFLQHENMFICPCLGTN